MSLEGPPGSGGAAPKRQWVGRGGKTGRRRVGPTRVLESRGPWSPSGGIGARTSCCCSCRRRFTPPSSHPPTLLPRAKGRTVKEHTCHPLRFLGEPSPGFGPWACTTPFVFPRLFFPHPSGRPRCSTSPDRGALSLSSRRPSTLTTFAGASDSSRGI